MAKFDCSTTIKRLIEALRREQATTSAKRGIMSSRSRHATVGLLSVVCMCLVAACGSSANATTASGAASGTTSANATTASGAASGTTSASSAATGTSTVSAAAPVCPSAGSVSTAMGSTYTGPTMAGSYGATSCDYSMGGDDVTVVFYPTIEQMMANIGTSASQVSVSGFGDSAFSFGDTKPGFFYVERSAADSFSVIDPYATNAQVEAVARVVLGE
jgi:hypothetical protein